MHRSRPVERGGADVIIVALAGRGAIEHVQGGATVATESANPQCFRYDPIDPLTKPPVERLSRAALPSPSVWPHEPKLGPRSHGSAPVPSGPGDLSGPKAQLSL